MPYNNLTKLANKLSKADRSTPVRPDLVERGLGAYEGTKRGATLGATLAGLAATTDAFDITNLNAAKNLNKITAIGGGLGGLYGASRPKSYISPTKTGTAVGSLLSYYMPAAVLLNNKYQSGEDITKYKPHFYSGLAADQVISQYARKRYLKRRSKQGKRNER